MYLLLNTFRLVCVFIAQHLPVIERFYCSIPSGYLVYLLIRTVLGYLVFLFLNTFRLLSGFIAQYFLVVNVFIAHLVLGYLV